MQPHEFLKGNGSGSEVSGTRRTVMIEVLSCVESGTNSGLAVQRKVTTSQDWALEQATNLFTEACEHSNEGLRESLLQEARTKACRIIEQVPDWPPPHILKARILIALGECEKARKHLDTVLGE